ncbi:protein of unknown function [Methylorubrum extorquens]|uniref:Uncharacterized protein n=1 Tax=Methylorubrum extorquens TaxID=408 RepID=A0A2N9AYE9_METEX|nr:protein of unknown function [Methylorubrum extorquens]
METASAGKKTRQQRFDHIDRSEVIGHDVRAHEAVAVPLKIMTTADAIPLHPAPGRCR